MICGGLENSSLQMQANRPACSRFAYQANRIACARCNIYAIRVVIYRGGADALTELDGYNNHPVERWCWQQTDLVG